MPTSTRKLREKRRRHALILEAAERILLERGYLGLTMDRIAQAVDYSKGTIYQHFANKEAVVIELVINTASIRAGLFERAATFAGRTRERMAALGVAAELFLRLYPDHFRSEQIVRASSVREKIPPERQRELAGCEGRCMSVATGLVRDAIAQGDLQLGPGWTPAELTFGLWCMSHGAFTIVALEQFPWRDLGIPTPLQTLWANQQRLLDGHGWRPLTGEHDYDATRERVLAEVFAPEVERLAAGRSA